MLFSASTMRVRWLHGSSALEKSVITAVRCWGTCALQRYFTSFQYSFLRK